MFLLFFIYNFVSMACCVFCRTKMFHPNVYASGAICLDILQDKWAPTLKVSSVLMSIQSLLDDPNPASPANSEAAELFEKNRPEYEAKVSTVPEVLRNAAARCCLSFCF